MNINEKLYWLTTANYAEEKRAVALEFWNLNGKVSKKIGFFPKLILPSNEAIEPIVRDLLKEFGSKKIKADFFSGKIVLTASTFSELKLFCNLLQVSSKIPFLLLSPERQFLIENNVSFFSAFKLIEGEMIKENCLFFPETIQPFFSEPFSDGLASLIKSEEKSAADFAKKIVYANLLCVPLSNVQLNKRFLMEKFFEKIFFKNSFPKILPVLEKQVFPAEKSNGFFPGPDFLELDFSNVLTELLSFSFNNIGFETINCDCCRPASVFEKNLLPNTMVSVQMLVDGLYFDSSSAMFAESFHENANGKEKRLLRMKEYHLNIPPIGPVFRKQSMLVPLPDAIDLEKSRQALLFDSTDKANWFCLKKESFLSKEIRELEFAAVFLNGFLLESDEQNLAGFAQSRFSPKNFFYSNALLSIKELSSLIPDYLASYSSEFYSPIVAEAIIALKNNLFFEFKRESRIVGERVVQLRNNRFLVNNQEALGIAKAFSNSTNLPMPKIE